MRTLTAISASIAVVLIGAASVQAAEKAGSGPTAPGGAVSAPQSPQNGAINTDANKTKTTQTSGSNSFTEGQAKGHIENAGYTEVTELTKTSDGRWTGKAKKGGKTMTISMDFKGAVTAK